MSVDAVVSALLADAQPALRDALRDRTLEVLLGDVQPALRELVRRSYETGYREGLAGTGTPAPAEAAVTPAAEPRLPPAGRIAWDELEDEDEGRRPGRRVSSPLRIFPHATVGTLHRRIIEAFDLERFDIEVILCRKGDRNRRQLSTSTKLARYQVEP